MEASRQRVKLQRELKDIAREEKEVKTKIALLDEVIELAMQSEEFPISSKVDGAAVFLEQTVWASALDKDHDALSAALKSEGLDWLLPHTVNSQTLSGYVREHIDPDRSLDISERIERGHPENGRLPASIVRAMKVSAVDKVKVTGA